MSEALIGAGLGAISGAVTALIVEKYKSKLEDRSRYYKSQFDLYNALWSSLHDLRLAADKLWEVADVENLRGFANQLQKTEDVVNRNMLLIEEDHLIELKWLIETFWKFDFGKEELIWLRKREDKYNRIDNRMVESVIERNRSVRARYNRLINEVATSFRRQLKTP